MEQMPTSKSQLFRQPAVDNMSRVENRSDPVSAVQLNRLLPVCASILLIILIILTSLCFSQDPSDLHNAGDNESTPHDIVAE